MIHISFAGHNNINNTETSGEQALNFKSQTVEWKENPVEGDAEHDGTLGKWSAVRFLKSTEAFTNESPLK